MSTWEKLSQINVNEHVKGKNGLSYLSWVWAWGETKKACPDANYRVINFDGKPYHFDENLGYMVQTEVTIEGETIPMHLFVMDGANKAQKHVAYTYQTKYKGEKTCEAATMFDINTCIMRCLTKNLAMFGLGHYIYAGEDLPEMPPAVLASPEVVNLISQSAGKVGADVGKALAHFQVGSLSELTEQQANAYLSKLNEAA